MDTSQNFVVMQRGYGLGSIFATLARVAVPAAARYLTPHVLRGVSETLVTNIPAAEKTIDHSHDESLTNVGNATKEQLAKQVAKNIGKSIAADVSFHALYNRQYGAGSPRIRKIGTNNPRKKRKPVTRSKSRKPKHRSTNSKNPKKQVKRARGGTRKTKAVLANDIFG